MPTSHLLVFVGQACQNSGRSFPGTLMVCWLFLFRATVIWNRPNVMGGTTTEMFRKAGGVTVGYGLWICAASGGWFFCNVGTVRGTVLSSKQLVMLRSDSSRFMFIKYVTLACFPEPVCSNSCCSRFKVSFTNATSNMAVCNNYVWTGFHQNLYILCVEYLHKVHEGKSPEVAVYDCYAGGRKTTRTPFFRAQCHLDIAGMRIVTIQCHNNGIFFFRQLHKTGREKNV